MAIPMAGGQMAELTAIYRENWQSAGHPGRGLVMMAFHMLCHPDNAEAANLARGPLNRYLRPGPAALTPQTTHAMTKS